MLITLCLFCVNLRNLWTTAFYRLMESELELLHHDRVPYLQRMKGKPPMLPVQPMPELLRQQQLVNALSKTGKTRIMETHISWVLLIGKNAYKIKKSLNLGFLDFSTLKARHFYCLEELRLNRRLAPDLYLKVIAIGGSLEQPLLNSEPAI